ncbi:MAG: peptidoglycan recognition family protein [Elusimicrobiota bacterium]|nr:peptidoglycan recognition protein family protein [Endomicrobiia bacterium]MDW8165126.1 peptidoglycan recognition family protein [Elusimicrobiota bacterium]
MRKIDYIVIHHSATLDGETFSWEAIRKYHIETLKWRDIGYNFGIEKYQGKTFILAGRDISEIPAHTSGLNTNSIGICVVGNYDNEILDLDKKQTLLFLLKTLMYLLDLSPERVIGHREYYVLTQLNLADKRYLSENIKTCPGVNFPMHEIRETLSKKFKVKNSNLFKVLQSFDREFLAKRKVFWV